VRVLEDFELNRNQCPTGDFYGYFCGTSWQIEPWLCQQRFMRIHGGTCLLVLMTIHGYWTTKKGLDDTSNCCTSFAWIQVARSSLRLSLYKLLPTRLSHSAVVYSVLRTEQTLLLYLSVTSEKLRPTMEIVLNLFINILSHSFCFVSTQMSNSKSEQQMISCIPVT
jgi:hypothetical protein